MRGTVSGVRYMAARRTVTHLSSPQLPSFKGVQWKTIRAPALTPKYNLPVIYPGNAAETLHLAWEPRGGRSPCSRPALAGRRRIPRACRLSPKTTGW